MPMDNLCECLSETYILAQEAMSVSQEDYRADEITYEMYEEEIDEQMSLQKTINTFSKKMCGRDYLITKWKGYLKAMQVRRAERRAEDAELGLDKLFGPTIDESMPKAAMMGLSSAVAARQHREPEAVRAARQEQRQRMVEANRAVMEIL